MQERKYFTEKEAQEKEWKWTGVEVVTDSVPCLAGDSKRSRVPKGQKGQVRFSFSLKGKRGYVLIVLWDRPTYGISVLNKLQYEEGVREV